MTIAVKLSSRTASLLGFALSIGLSSNALALPPVANVALGNGVSTTGHVIDIPVGGTGGPGLLTVTALSPHTSKQGTVGNVMLLNSQRLVGVTAGPSGAGKGISLANPTGRPVFSSVSSLPALNGGGGPQ